MNPCLTYSILETKVATLIKESLLTANTVKLNFDASLEHFHAILTEIYTLKFIGYRFELLHSTNFFNNIASLVFK